MFKKIMITLVLFGCGGNNNASRCENGCPIEKPTVEVVASQSLSCTVTSDKTGSLITCPDGSSSQINNGLDGKSGTDGIGTPGMTGANGYSVVFTVSSANATQCPTGGSIIVMGEDSNSNGYLDTLDTSIQTSTICNGANGSTGAAGTNGTNGTNGTDGKDGTNGTNGTDGATGATGAQGAPGPVSSFSPVSLIQPCTAASSPWKEVLLCLNDNTILADFSDNASGLNTRLSLVPAGSYIDTDSSGCNFSVSTYGTGLKVSWNAGSNQYATWAAGSSVCDN